MEVEQDGINENEKIKVELIYYLNDDEEKKGNLKFSYDKNNEIISYGDITNSFYSFLKENQGNEIDNPEKQNMEINENNIIYGSIRYYVGEGWIILKENDVIFLDEELTLDNLKIMIYSNIIGINEMNIKKKYDKIDKEINYIYKQINIKAINDSLLSYSPLNLVVLTANPLMDGNKELRTMNDFNIITKKIYDSFEGELKYTEFLPLTFNTFKNAITNKQKRPAILHLICKSTYIIPEQEKDKISSENSEDYTNLIFENDKNYYNLEFINKKKLEDEIFKNPKLEEKVKENIKKIILIISTPLSKDVYNIFSKFGFKNILVQHTTLADLEFIADFNYTFYSDIITHIPQPINSIYEDALINRITYENPPTFCCCFHEHKTNCEFFKNLVNELYNSKGRVELKEYKKIAPHFNHLFPDCYYDPECNKLIHEIKNNPQYSNIGLPTKSFCFHDNTRCYNKYKYLPKIDKKDYIEITLIKENKEKKPKQQEFSFMNLCCCKKDPQIHNESSVFLTDFSDEKNNNEIIFRNTEIIREKIQYIPDFEKMISFVGNNEVIYKTLQFFSSSDNNLNIYGDNIQNLKKLGETIIEYYLERYNFYEQAKSKLNITRIKSATNFNNNLKEENDNNNIINEDIKLHSLKSAPLIGKGNKENFVEINLTSDYIDNPKEEINIDNNTIYFIYVHSLNQIDKIKNKHNKKVWFSEEKMIEQSIKFNKEHILQEYKMYLSNIYEPNDYIKCQHKKRLRNYWRRKK